MWCWIDIGYRIMVWSFLAWIGLSDWTSIFSLLTVTFSLLAVFFIAATVTMKDASIGFNELVFHMFMALFSFFTNLSLRLPNLDDVVINGDHSECFFPEMNALQLFGILLVVCDKDGGHFIMGIVSVFAAWIAFTAIKWNRNDPNENETPYTSEIKTTILPRFILLISTLLSLTFTYYCVQSILTFVLIILSSYLKINDFFDVFLNYCKQIDRFYFINVYTEDIFLMLCLSIDLSMLTVAVTFIQINKRYILLVPIIYETWKQLLKLYKTELNVLQRRKDLFKNTTLCSKTDIRKNGENCPICLQKMTTARKTLCGHVFHSKCLGLCLQQNAICPLCRTDFNSSTVQNKRD